MEAADLLGSQGDLVELVSYLAMRRMLLRAESVRFLVPITAAQVQEGKGAVGQLVRQLQRICSSTLRDSVASVQLVVSHCSPSDEGLDLEALRALVAEQLRKEFHSEEKAQ